MECIVHSLPIYVYWSIKRFKVTVVRVRVNISNNLDRVSVRFTVRVRDSLRHKLDT